MENKTYAVNFEGFEKASGFLIARAPSPDEAAKAIQEYLSTSGIEKLVITKVVDVSAEAETEQKTPEIVN